MNIVRGCSWVSLRWHGTQTCPVCHLWSEGTGIIDEVKSIFEKAGVAVSIYDKVESNPQGLQCHGCLLICSTGPDTF